MELLAFGIVALIAWEMMFRVIKRLLRRQNPRVAATEQPSTTGHRHESKAVPTPVAMSECEIMNSCPTDEAFNVKDSMGVHAGCPDCQHRPQYRQVLFSWSHGGQRVYLTGSFYNWCLKVPMPFCSRCSANVVELTLPIGHHEYKFIVDSLWTIDNTKPTCNNYIGDENNVLHLYSGKN